MKAIGAGVRELRIRERLGAFRVIYLATLPDRVVVLHALPEETQRTSKRDIDLAAGRGFVICGRIDTWHGRHSRAYGMRSKTLRRKTADIRARSELMIAVRSKIESWKVSQTEAARPLGADAKPRG